MGIKVAVVGLGHGQRHAESLRKCQGVEVAALADLDPVRTKKCAEQYGARAYPNWKELLAGEKHLDAVILATPAVVRLEPIEAIAARGIALFCEKPPAANLAAARQIAQVIEQAGILNTVGFQFRWSPCANRMRELIRGRARCFARLVIAWPVFSWVAAGHAPKHLYDKFKSGGPMIEQGIHYQDVLRYISEDEIVQVMAMAEMGRTEPKQGRDCEDTTALVARHASGMLTTHVHNWSHQGTVMDLQITGESFDLTWQMAADRLVGSVDKQKIDEPLKADYYFEEIVGFVAAVKARDQSLLRSPYADACRTLAVCQAAADSVVSGQTVQVPDAAPLTAAR